MNKTGMIILAAGSSSRLGRPKQSLPYKGKTLLTHVVGEALEAGFYPVVVTGAIGIEIDGVDTVYNPDWQSGMAGSIVSGLKRWLLLNADATHVIIAVCDQPYISAGLLRQLIDEKVVSGKGIVACTYANTVGTPVLFGRAYFGSLLALSGNEGAKKLLLQFTDDRALVPFEGGEVDIDTIDDYRRLG